MGSQAAILRSLIFDLERFGRLVESLTASNRAQIESASNHLDDSHKLIKQEETLVRKNGSFLP